MVRFLFFGSKVLLFLSILFSSCVKDRLWEITPENPTNPPVDTVILPLKINEFLASNNGSTTDPNGEFDDWIEIYNPNNESVDIAGYLLTDNLSSPSLASLPFGFSETIIPPNGFVVIWCDGTPDQGPLHVGFKLSGSGEEIGLFKADESIVDTLSYVAQTSDFSFGRIPDGTNNWQVIQAPTPGQSND
jgi:hypothetical protein